jgi:hypothetical protein
LVPGRIWSIDCSATAPPPCIRVRRPGPAGHPALGGLAETFVFNELTKAAALAEVATTIYHYRE